MSSLIKVVSYSSCMHIFACNVQSIMAWFICCVHIYFVCLSVCLFVSLVLRVFRIFQWCLEVIGTRVMSNAVISRFVGISNSRAMINVHVHAYVYISVRAYHWVSVCAQNKNSMQKSITQKQQQQHNNTTLIKVWAINACRIKYNDFLNEFFTISHHLQKQKQKYYGIFTMAFSFFLFFFFFMEFDF